MKNETIVIRLTEQQKKIIESKARMYGFKAISEYIRVVALNAVVRTEAQQ